MSLQPNRMLICATAFCLASCLDTNTEYCGGADGLRCPTGHRCVPVRVDEWACQPSQCGDGVISNAAGEQCDDGEETEGCDIDCTLPVCGDGYTNIIAGETCDDGNTEDGDLCSSQCLASFTRPTLAVGGNHACALVGRGGQSDLRCWGQGNRGQLGYGNAETIGDDEPPTAAGPVRLDGEVKGLAAGGFHTCALLQSNAVRCWGAGDGGQLGYGDGEDVGVSETLENVPEVEVDGEVKYLAAGGFHTCALMLDGTVRCWGEGSHGQLGYGNTESIGRSSTPASVGTVKVGNSVVQLVAGATHTCALLDSGDVRCWGASDDGQLGHGNINNRSTYETPETIGDVQVGARVKQLAAGFYHTCALLDDGDLRCWGRGSDGQLGYGNVAKVGDDETPSSRGDVPVGTPVKQVVAGGFHTCALLESESEDNVRCWGRGSDGQLGNSNTDNIGDDESPGCILDDDPEGCTVHNVSLGGTATWLAAGTSHTCALLDTGKVRCWGNGSDGQLGYGSVDNSGESEELSMGDIELGGDVPQPEPVTE